MAERAKGTAVAMAAQAAATAGPATEAAAVMLMEGVAAKVAAQARTSRPPFWFCEGHKKETSMSSKRCRALESGRALHPPRDEAPPL